MTTLIDSKVIRNIVFNYGTQLAVSGLGFVWMLLATRFAGTSAYGQLALLNALAGMMGNVLTFRSNEAVVRYYREGVVTGSQGLCRLALFGGLVLDFVMGGVLLFLMHLLAPTIASKLLHSLSSTHIVVVYSFGMFANFVRGTSMGLLAAEERFSVINSIPVFEKGAQVAIVAIALLLGRELDLNLLVWAVIGPAFFVTCFVVFWAPIRLLRDLKGVKGWGGRTSDYARFCCSTFFSSLLKAGNQHVDSIILGYMLTPAAAGIYSVCKQFTNPLLMLSAPFGTQMYPKFVHAITENNRIIVESTIMQVNRKIAVGSYWLIFLLVPGFILSTIWNNIGLTAIHFVTFGLLLASNLIMQKLWWTRSLALSINPNLSLILSFVSTLIVLLLFPLAIYCLGFLGLGIVTMLSSMILYFCWKRVRCTLIQ